MATSVAPPRTKSDTDNHGSALLILGGLGAVGLAGFLWWQHGRSSTVPPPAPPPPPTPTPTPTSSCAVRPQNASDSSRAQYGENWQVGVPVWTLDSSGSIVHSGETIPYGTPLPLIGGPVVLPSPHYFGHDVTVRTIPGNARYIGIYDVVNC